MSDNLSKPGSKPSDNKMTKSGTFGDSNRPKNGLTLGSGSGKFGDGSALRKEKTITLGRVGGDGTYSSSNSVSNRTSNGNGSNSDQQNEFASKSAPDLWRQPQDQQPHNDESSTVKMQYGDDNDIDIIYEECTPERLLV